MDQQSLISEVATQLNAQNYERAENLLNQFITQFGETFDSLFFKGIIAFNKHDYTGAIAELTKAHKINQSDLRVIYNLGVSNTRLELYADAMGWFKKILAVKPDHIPTLLMVSATFEVTGNPSACENSCNIILRHDPNNVSALNNLGNACKNSGKPREAVAAYEKALSLNPNVDAIRSNLLFALNYAAHDPISLLNDHKLLAHHWDNPQWQYRNLEKKEKLRIGFVSPDFSKHSCAYFLRGLYTALDRERFFLASYGNVEFPDSLTTWFEEQSDLWRDINEISSAAAAQQIKDDNIDILIDLAGHTGGSNLAIFGLQPAPVQVTWLGYPATTGMNTIHYRITDPVADPEECDSHYTEKLKRLPHFLNYSHTKEIPDFDFSQFKSRDHTVFGSFNNIAKLTPETIELWGAVLTAVPDSTLLIKHKNFNDPGVQELFLHRFREAGIDTNRLIFHEFNFTDKGHMEEYNQVDIALDSYPYNGTTTTFEAMVMGVPTITLTGTVHASRVGTTINKGAGLESFIAATPEEFVRCAVESSKDRKKLLHLKESLRTKFYDSPFADYRTFTRNFENALIEMWEEQCE